MVVRDEGLSSSSSVVCSKVSAAATWLIDSSVDINTLVGAFFLFSFFLIVYLSFAHRHHGLDS